VVFANWRDSRHPKAGGAELYCESAAQRLAERGLRVTLLTSRPSGAPRNEMIGGVHIRRGGGTLGVYVHALTWLLRHRRVVDAVVDCQNGIPFFSPLVTRAPVPVVCLIFHVHQDQFASYFRWPIARIGRWLEGPVSRVVYGQRAIAVISPSTRAGVRNRLNLRGAVHVVPCGVEPCSARHSGEIVPRSREPRIVCVGRLVPHKRVHLLIQAIPEVLGAHPDLKVSIVGTGVQLENLRVEAEELGLAGTVEFHGQVSNDQRERLLRGAWLTVNPSAGEGWGLSVIEANACGVPALAFRVPGLQDSIVSGRTGWLADPHAALGPVIGEALNILRDPRAAEEWSRRVRGWAARFSWDATATRLLDVIAQEEKRLLRDASVPGGDQRCQSDLACHVSLPADVMAAFPVAASSRRTDVWISRGERVEGLMPGADETGVRCALERLGVAEHAQVRVARPADWLLGGDLLT
jgi:glycosyltransferase involved in cell wall biosynthesis